MIFNIPCPDILITNQCNMSCKYCFEKDKGNDNMDKELVLEYYSHNPCTSTFIFGGEPLLKLDILLDIIDQVKQNPNINNNRKGKLLNQLKKIITNGTLVKNNIEKIKKYKLEMQISLDGPKHINDSYRIFSNKKGTFDRVIEATQICKKEKIPCSVHGVVAKETLKYFTEIFIFFFEFYIEFEGLEKAIEHMKQNNFQIIFEDDYTDEDIDILISEFHKTADWIYTRDYLTLEQKNALFHNFLEKHGGVCGAGTGLLALDAKLDMYPCHRLAIVPDKSNFYIGNAMDIKTISNYSILNSFYNIGVKSKYMYSAVTDNKNYKNEDNLKWFMWCPSTNLQTSDTVYYQSAKYNVMMSEVNRAIKKIKKVYYKKTKKEKNGINRKPHNC